MRKTLLRWASAPVLVCCHGLHPVPAARTRSSRMNLSTLINVISFLGSVTILLLMIGATLHARLH